MAPKEIAGTEGSPAGTAPHSDAVLDADRPLVPADALLEALKLQEAGRLKDAYELCRKVKKADPENADAFNLGGVIAFQGGRKSLARKLLRRAVSLAPEHAGAHNNLGIVHKETGALKKAVASFQRSLEINPDDADTNFNLGNAYSGLGRHTDAAAAFGRAAELRPDFVDALYNRANMLAEIGRYELAVETFRRVIDFISDFAEAHYALGKALSCTGQFEAAIAAFEEALKFEPRHKHALDELTVATMRGRGPQALIDLCDARLSRDPGNQIALSAKAIGLHELERDEEAGALVDIDRFVRPVRLDVPDGFDSVDAFNTALVDHILAHPTLEFEPNAHATRFGKHTGNLNKQPKGPIAQLESAIFAAADEYVSDTPADPPHPFFDRVPKRSRQIIWSVVMQSQGHQIPHIHPQAWLSGVYYPKLPSVIDRPDAEQAGWIEFGQPPESFQCARAAAVKTFKPEEGLMFLFPSFFYHRTIPFDGDEQRVSVAFDLIAVD